VSQIKQCQLVELLNSDELDNQDSTFPAEISKRESSGQNSIALLLHQIPGRHVKSGNILFCNGALLQERIIASDWTEDILSLRICVCVLNNYYFSSFQDFNNQFWICNSLVRIADPYRWDLSWGTWIQSKTSQIVTVIHFNLLKPTGYVMHHQINIQQLYALPTLYLCVLYLSENKQRLVPLTA